MFGKKKGNTTPFCQSSGPAPDVHVTLKNHERILCTAGPLPQSFFNHLGNFSPGDKPGSPGPASSPEASRGNWEVFPPPIHSILGWNQQHTIPTVHSVDSALLPLPQMVVQSQKGLCRTPSVRRHPSLPVSARGCCRHNRHWPSCSYSKSAASTMEAANMAPQRDVPRHPPGTWKKLSRRRASKFLLTGDWRSQQTLTIRLGLPGLTDILPDHRSQLTTRWWSAVPFLSHIVHKSVYICVSEQFCFAEIIHPTSQV